MGYVPPGSGQLNERLELWLAGIVCALAVAAAIGVGMAGYLILQARVTN
jgi:hypothetical protein